MFKKKQKLSPEEIAYNNRLKSFQELLPIQDIKGRLFITKNNEYFPMFSIGQKSIDLMSEEEKVEFAHQVDNIFATMAIEGFEILAIPVPFDIEPYKRNQINYTKALQKEMNRYNYLLADTPESEKEIRASLSRKIEQIEGLLKYVKDQQDFVVRNLQTGRVANKQCYLVPKIEARYDEIATQEAARTIESKLKQLSSGSHRCSEQEMRDVLFAMLNPLRKEIYKTQPTQYTPQLDEA